MRWSCLNCGLENETDLQNCFKCDTPLISQTIEALSFIDIAHHGETWEKAKDKLLNAINNAIVSHHRGLKVIHGKGSGVGHTHIIKNKAFVFLREYADQNRCKLVKDKFTDGAHILYFGDVKN